MRAIIQKMLTPYILPCILHAGTKLLGCWGWHWMWCRALLNALQRVILMIPLECKVGCKVLIELNFINITMRHNRSVAATFSNFTQTMPQYHTYISFFLLNLINIFDVQLFWFHLLGGIRS